MHTNENTANMIPRIPPHEIVVRFERASGPGGQNVNKRATKAVLLFDLESSETLADEQREAIRRTAGKRVSKDGVVVLTADDERSQEQNRKEVLRKLDELIAEALTPQKPRKATKPSRASKEKRLQDKAFQSRKKAERRKPIDNGY